MSDVIDELSDDNTRIDRHHVERRVADWQARVVELYDRIGGWLPSSYTEDRDHSLPMKEEMMARHGVPAIEMPIMNIRSGDAWIAKLVPKGLWIIGANGRIDLFTPNSLFLLVDRAENFAKPQWYIAPALQREKQKPLTRDELISALGA